MDRPRKPTPGRDRIVFGAVGIRPNPTGGNTTLSYDRPAADEVSLTICDAAGRRVRSLVDDSPAMAGHQEILGDGRTSDGEPVPAGVCFARVGTRSGTPSLGTLIVVR